MPILPTLGVSILLAGIIFFKWHSQCLPSIWSIIGAKQGMSGYLIYVTLTHLCFGDLKGSILLSTAQIKHDSGKNSKTALFNMIVLRHM